MRSSQNLPPMEGFPYNILFLIPFKDEIMAWAAPKMVVNPAMLSGPAELARIHQITSTFSEDRCRRLAADFVADGTWQVPTLIRLKTSELADAPEFNNDPNLRYIPSEEVRLWRATAGTFIEKFSPASRNVLRDHYAMHVKLVKLFDASGVKMMTGDDAGGAQWIVPGFALHQEFDEFAMAGVSPLHVLQDATLNGAEFLGRTSTMGSVEVGKNADLVVLDANPVASVESLHKIDAVVRAGFYFSRDDLKAMKDKVRASEADVHH
jgi:imidazolonepropionase-like amidohydrolase